MAAPRRTSRRESVGTIQGIRRLSRRISVSSVNTIKDYVFGRKASRVEVDDFLIDNVRQQVLEGIADSESNLVDTRDVPLIKSDSQLIARFIADRKLYDPRADNDRIISLTTAYLLTWLKWRMSFGVHDLMDQVYFKEAWECGIVEVHMDKDAAKDHLVYVYIRKWKKSEAHITSLVLRFIIGLAEVVISKMKPGQRFRIVLDTSGIGLSNADISLALGVVPIWMNYYPGLIKSFDVIDSGMLVRAGMSVIMKIFPPHQRDRVHFIDRKTLVEEVGPASVPKCMGGTGEEVTNLSIFAKDNCPTIEEYAKENNFSGDTCKRFKKMLLESQKP